SPTRCATSRGTAGGGGTVIPVNSVNYEVFLLILQFQYSGQASIVQQKHHPHAGCDERSCWHTHCIATVDLGLDTLAAAAPSAARAYHRAPKSSTAAPATLIGAPTISTLVSSAAPKDNVVPVVHEEESFNQTSTSYHSFTKSLQWKLSLANDYYKLLEKWSDDLGYAVKKGRGGRKTTQWTYTECRVASTGGLRLLKSSSAIVSYRNITRNGFPTNYCHLLGCCPFHKQHQQRYQRHLCTGSCTSDQRWHDARATGVCSCCLLRYRQHLLRAHPRLLCYRGRTEFLRHLPTGETGSFSLRLPRPLHHRQKVDIYIPKSSSAASSTSPAPSGWLRR
ncbi:hypothetical protein B296_00047002, partial [Ensete ventricosum]